MTWTCCMTEGGEAESQRYSYWRNLKVVSLRLNFYAYLLCSWMIPHHERPGTRFHSPSTKPSTWDMLSKHMVTSTFTQLLLLPRKALPAYWTQGIECDTDSRDAERDNRRVFPTEQRTPGKRSSSSGKGENLPTLQDQLKWEKIPQ